VLLTTSDCRPNADSVRVKVARGPLPAASTASICTAYCSGVPVASADAGSVTVTCAGLAAVPTPLAYMEVLNGLTGRLATCTVAMIVPAALRNTNAVTGEPSGDTAGVKLTDSADGSAARTMSTPVGAPLTIDGSSVAEPLDEYVRSAEAGTEPTGAEAYCSAAATCMGTSGDTLLSVWAM
jgi:hypothetical protein